MHPTRKKYSQLIILKVCISKQMYSSDLWHLKDKRNCIVDKPLKSLGKINNRQFPLYTDFYLGKKVYSQKEHTKISKIAKFGCELL
jgi:hypothetical protein